LNDRALAGSRLIGTLN
jgi:hypothetical protein